MFLSRFCSQEAEEMYSLGEELKRSVKQGYALKMSAV